MKQSPSARKVGLCFAIQLVLTFIDMAPLWAQEYGNVTPPPPRPRRAYSTMDNYLYTHGEDPSAATQQERPRRKRTSSKVSLHDIASGQYKKKASEEQKAATNSSTAPSAKTSPSQKSSTSTNPAAESNNKAGDAIRKHLQDDPVTHGATTAPSNTSRVTSTSPTATNSSKSTQTTPSKTQTTNTTSNTTAPTGPATVGTNAKPPSTTNSPTAPAARKFAGGITGTLTSTSNVGNFKFRPKTKMEAPEDKSLDLPSVRLGKIPPPQMPPPPNSLDGIE